MNNQEQLIALSQQVRQAMVDKDFITLEKLILEDGVIKDRLGYAQSREAWLESMRFGRITYFAIIEENMAVEILTEDTAKVYMRIRTDSQFFTMRDVWDLHVVLNAVKIGDDWKVERLLFRPYNEAYDFVSKTSPDEKELIHLSRQVRQAMVDQDTAVIEQIMAEGAILYQQTGYQQPKEEWIAYMKNGKMRYISATEVSIEAQVEGNKGRVVMRNHVDAQIYGSRNIWNLQLTFHFERMDGTWKIMKAVARPFTLE